MIISILTLLLMFSTLNAKEHILTVRGTLPVRIEFHAEDPPCTCLWTDYFQLIRFEKKQLIGFADDNNEYLERYYVISQRVSPEVWVPFGGNIYTLKNKFQNKVFTIRYARRVCKKYKDCQMGKIYKNYILTIQ